MNATIISGEEFRFLAQVEPNQADAVVCHWLTEANRMAYLAAERAHRRLALAVLSR
jgi:hypothetical protein